MQEEAAERRRQENENRGIKNPEKVRYQQQRAAQMEKDELEATKRGAGNPSLKVNEESAFLSIEIVELSSNANFKLFSVASGLNVFKPQLNSNDLDNDVRNESQTQIYVNRTVIVYRFLIKGFHQIGPAAAVAFCGSTNIPKHSNHV